MQVPSGFAKCKSLCGGISPLAFQVLLLQGNMQRGVAVLEGNGGLRSCPPNHQISNLRVCGKRGGG